MTEIGFGIVGLGIGATRARWIAATPGARLVAVCDRIEERRAEAEATWGVKTYDDFGRMLEDPDVDVVGIFTPAGSHMEMTLDAISAGKHVLTTKAMEINIERCDRMIDAAKAAGKVLLTDLDSRYAIRNRAIKLACDQGLFGQLLIGEAKLKCSRDQSYYGWNGGWRGTWRWDGGGSLANQAIHYIDRLRWFMGEPASVRAHTGVFTHRIEAEDLGVALIHWKGGGFGTFAGTTTAVPDFEHSSIELSGTHGGVITRLTSLKYTPEPGVGEQIERWIMTDDKGETIRAEPIDVPPGPTNVIEDMVAVLLEGTEPFLPGTEGRKSVELLNGIYESSQTGADVTFPLQKPFIPAGGLKE